MNKPNHLKAGHRADTERVRALLAQKRLHPDQISQLTGLSAQRVSAALTLLSVTEQVIQHPGNFWSAAPEAGAPSKTPQVRRPDPPLDLELAERPLPEPPPAGRRATAPEAVAVPAPPPKTPVKAPARPSAGKTAPRPTAPALTRYPCKFTVNLTAEGGEQVRKLAAHLQAASTAEVVRFAVAYAAQDNLPTERVPSPTPALEPDRVFITELATEWGTSPEKAARYARSHGYPVEVRRHPVTQQYMKAAVSADSAAGLRRQWEADAAAPAPSEPTAAPTAVHPAPVAPDPALEPTSEGEPEETALCEPATAAGGEDWRGMLAGALVALAATLTGQRKRST